MGWHLIQNKENYMKKKDLILAGAVLLLAGILALALRLPKTENGNTMKVTVDGEVYGTYSLAENQTVKIQTGHGTNVLVIENGSAHMEEADCPDGYCKEQGRISGQKQIKQSIRNLVADFVRMAGGNRFAGEKVTHCQVVPVVGGLLFSGIIKSRRGKRQLFLNACAYFVILRRCPDRGRWWFLTW